MLTDVGFLWLKRRLLLLLKWQLVGIYELITSLPLSTYSEEIKRSQSPGEEGAGQILRWGPKASAADKRYS